MFRLEHDGGRCDYFNNNDVGHKGRRLKLCAGSDGTFSCPSRTASCDGYLLHVTFKYYQHSNNECFIGTHYVYGSIALIREPAVLFSKEMSV